MHGIVAREDGEGFRAEVAAGLRDIAAPAVAAVPIGLLFGALAAAKGLTVLDVGAMSALVFAGGAQFAAVEIWSHPVPVGALVFSTLLINLRHVLMGASLAPRLGRFSRRQKLLWLAVMVDETWAFAERRAVRRPLTPAYFGTMGAVYWISWLVWSLLGACAGSMLGDPRRVGADFAFTALFIGLVAGFGRTRAGAAAIAASGLAAAGTALLLGPPWHVAAGAGAGILAAALAAPGEAPR
ncbi:AzlC family ABC transporter permease [Methylobacterium sp. JK268]